MNHVFFFFENDPFDKRLSSWYEYSVFQITLPYYISKHSVSDVEQSPLIPTDVRVHAAGVWLSPLITYGWTSCAVLCVCVCVRERFCLLTHRSVCDQSLYPAPRVVTDEMTHKSLGSPLKKQGTYWFVGVCVWEEYVFLTSWGLFDTVHVSNAF